MDVERRLRDEEAAGVGREQFNADTTPLASDQATVIVALGAALKRLADGDLSVRVGRLSGTGHDGLRHDFEDGVRLVDQAGEEVVVIAASANKQATSLVERNTAVNQMDQVTQQNAAMVEQTTAAGQRLTQEVERLSRSLDGFRLGSAAPGRPLAATPPIARRASAAPALPNPSTSVPSRRREPVPCGGWDEF